MPDVTLPGLPGGPRVLVAANVQGDREGPGFLDMVPTMDMDRVLAHPDYHGYLELAYEGRRPQVIAGQHYAGKLVDVVRDQPDSYLDEGLERVALRNKDGGWHGAHPPVGEALRQYATWLLHIAEQIEQRSAGGDI